MKRVEDFIHLLGLFLSPVLILVAFYLQIHKEILEFFVIPIAILLSILLLIRESYSNKEDEIRLFRTFLFDKFYSTKLGKPLIFNAEIFVVEADFYKHRFRNNLRRIFHDEVEKGNLTIKTYEWDDSNDEEQKRRLAESIKRAKAVIVVRTKELEEKAWVYDIVEEWATKHPENPCLYVRDIADKDCKSKVPENYFWIHDEPKSVPWNLLQRSSDRSFAWRTQASFNKLMWKHTAILLTLFISVFVYYLVDHRKQDEAENRLKTQQSEYFTILKNRYIQNNPGLVTEIRDGLARRMAELVENSVLNFEDDHLFASYWIVDESLQPPLRQIGTSDKKSGRTPWEKDTNSIVGCAFVNENHFVEWKGDSFARVFTLDGVEKPENKCSFGERTFDNIKSMVCLAINKSSSSQNATGICIKTESATIISKYTYRNLLRERVTDYYQQTLEMTNEKNKIENRELPVSETIKK